MNVRDIAIGIGVAAGGYFLWRYLMPQMDASGGVAPSLGGGGANPAYDPGNPKALAHMSTMTAGATATYGADAAGLGMPTSTPAPLPPGGNVLLSMRRSAVTFSDSLRRILGADRAVQPVADAPNAQTTTILGRQPVLGTEPRPSARFLG